MTARRPCAHPRTGILGGAQQKTLDQPFEALSLFSSRLCISVARTIHDVELLADAVPVERLRAARRLRDSCDLRAKEGVQKAGLPDVRAAEDRESGHGVPFRAFARPMSRQNETHIGARSERTSHAAGPDAGARGSGNRE